MIDKLNGKHNGKHNALYRERIHTRLALMLRRGKHNNY